MSDANYVRDRSHKPMLPGIVYMWQIKAGDMCGTGQVAFYQHHNLNSKEIYHFIKNGMPIEEFKQRFGHDAMAQQAIEYWERNYGRK